PGLGYIEPGPPLALRDFGVRPAYEVAAFHEKPSIEAALQLQQKGALWNSFVMVFHPARLLALIERRRRADMERLRAVVGSNLGYERVSRWNFSKDFLVHVPQHLAVVPVDGVSWSDWGTPETVARTLATLRRESSLGEAPGRRRA